MILAALTLVVDSIRIESRWGGLGTPSDKTYKIVRRGDQYFRGDIAVSQQAVERLMSAMNAAPVARPTALRALMTPQWLAATAHATAAGVPQCSAEAKRVFEKRLSDPEFALRVMDEYFSERWTDDYPFVNVQVTLQTGRTMQAESHAQPALMLPWIVDEQETWNPALPRAIAALLPAGAEERISGESLASRVAQDAAREMENELEPLEERCLHRDIADATERVFKIVRIYHGAPGDFTAYVQRADFPPNLVLTLVIRDADKPGALAKLDRTVERLGTYLEIARPYLAQHRRTWFALWCDDGVSAGDRSVNLMEYDPETGRVGAEHVIEKR